MHNGHISNYRKGYDFVSFGKRQNYSADNNAVYSGYIDLDIICCSELHIGNGYNYFVNTKKELAKGTLKLNGKPIIPGSSFKGAVRAIASAASYSCNPKSKCNAKNHCIVCKTFGYMGMASKVIFPDFLSDNAVTKVMTFNSQFSPQKKEKGKYKFYLTDENNYSIKDKVNAEVVESGSVFSGRIFFKKLTEEQLSLLMFSMGLNNKKLINLKIGGFKNEGIGEVYTEVKAFKADDLNKKPCDLAAQYVNMRSANKEAIDKINYILLGGEAT